MEFLSTHPASTRRIENMSKWLPKANEIYEQSDCSSMGNYYKSFSQCKHSTSYALFFCTQ